MRDFPSPPANARTRTRAQQLHADLAGLVADGHIPADCRINENRLAAQLGASRTPLREALNRLAGEGLIRAIPGGFATLPDDPTAFTPLARIRQAIELVALDLTLHTAPPHQIAQFVAWLEHNDPCPADVRGDEAFHLRLCDLAQAPELTCRLRPLLLRLRPYRTAQGVTADQAHHRIALALARQDRAAARAFLTAHLAPAPLAEAATPD
ncbi:GntR family transcriptional regulator [Pseudoprimorskyibacter insulae]|uniref:HTH-type transcriptional regulator McbR n=1 Tax=Pseudoprimorskyibacter insulae TaxID=1695997 RepID=A0A2R8AQ27_9RHOB|nr:GntR family transcriptional regulator [Pseudoprimorskyibacter insulae]SPF78132.1 HTH-type transcriptional regulator McbR [Pseudoprimorskyibacter insulae]